jgi:hypothetical protein
MCGNWVNQSIPFPLHISPTAIVVLQLPDVEQEAAQVIAPPMVSISAFRVRP